MTVAARVVIDGLGVRLGQRNVLRHVSCRFDAPGLVALAGPNGAGKSTLLRVLAGLVVPTSGRVTIDAADALALSPAARAAQIAYMPQDRTVHWNMPAHAIVALGRLPHREAGRSTAAGDTAAIAHALARADAAHLAERPVLSLSGGERARVLMARALAQDARVLLADEPAAGLDPAHQFALLETLARIAEGGTRVIVVLHDLALISRFATQIVLLDDGAVAANGAPRDVLSAARLAAVYGVTATAVDGMLVPTGRV